MQQVDIPQGSAPRVRRARGAPVPGMDRTLRTVGVLGTGSYVPQRLLGNAELERMVATSDEWIMARTGVHERHIAAAGQATSDLAIAAGRRALEQAGLDAGDLGLILVATATPDQVTPSTACFVQRGLEARNAAGFDVDSACSGFAHALMTAHYLVAGGAYENALVIGADTLSSITDYQDRESCVLFGDGAGALLIGAKSNGGVILDHLMGLDGKGADLIQVKAGGSRLPASHATVDQREHYLHMQGRKVFRFAVPKICELTDQILARNNLSIEDLDLLVPHQANQRILEAAARALGIDPERVLMNVDRFGNTSNASIPLALDEAARGGRLQPGMLVLLVAFGAGLSWGANLLRW